MWEKNPFSSPPPPPPPRRFSPSLPETSLHPPHANPYRQTDRQTQHTHTRTAPTHSTIFAAATYHTFTHITGSRFATSSDGLGVDHVEPLGRLAEGLPVLVPQVLVAEVYRRPVVDDLPLVLLEEWGRLALGDAPGDGGLVVEERPDNALARLVVGGAVRHALVRVVEDDGAFSVGTEVLHGSQSAHDSLGRQVVGHPLPDEQGVDFLLEPCLDQHLVDALRVEVTRHEAHVLIKRRRYRRTLHESELLVLHDLLVDLIHGHRVPLAQLGQPGEFRVITGAQEHQLQRG
mmetsp:Transcript_16680/g.47520  ORF Transcript_16680/g.47520 Transcript_16680/m.47520 type:complete len:289 (-) Transcript_16680:440-1306(-)